jgi:hypothetical protein
MSFDTPQERATFIHEFGEPVILLPGTDDEVEIPVLPEEIGRVDKMVEGTRLAFTAIESDLEPVQNGSPIQKDGIAYTIRSMQPDGTGFMHVQVSED